MKATGIVRKVDGLGRIVLPKELRKVLRICTGDPVEMYVDSDGIFVKKFDAIGDIEQLLDKTEGDIQMMSTLLTTAQYDALLAKVREMKDIIGPEKN